MKNKGLICLVLCLLLGIQALPLSASAEATGNLSIQSGCHTIDGQVPVLGTEELVSNAKAVLLYETTTDTLMYSWHADDQMYPASLVKIMTALIVLQKGNLSDVVTVTEDVLKTVDKTAVTAKLQADEQITVENLLYCMLVDSANDAAAVLAAHVLGTQEAFVEEMNRYAQELGCTGTQFVNVHGLHDKNQYTTARDMGRILTEALKSEIFQTIFGTVHYTVPATNKSEERKLESGNFLMNRDRMDIYYDSRVTGGRTGITTDGERCIAASAEHDGLRFVSIVMGASSEYEDETRKVKSFGGFPETSNLLDLGFKDYKPCQILYTNQIMRQYSVANGASDVLAAPKVSISTVLPSNVYLDGLKIQYKESAELSVPIQKDQQLSTVEIWYENTCLAQAELYAMNSVTAKNVTAVPHQKESSHTLVVVLLGIVGVLLLFVLYIFGSRFFHKRKIAARRHRVAKDRRRSR